MSIVRHEAIASFVIHEGMTVQTGAILDPRVEGRYVIRTDPHCHILPGLDDGSPDLYMSLRMAKRMTHAGIRNAIASPHGAHPGIQTNVDPDFLRDHVAALNGALIKESIPLTVYPGTEIYLRRRVMNLFDKGKLITWADQGKFILVELGFQRRSEGTLEVIDHFIDAGLIPIIAHPERYHWLPDDMALFQELRSRGCVFQFNTMSINGHFGPRMQQLALRLLPVCPHFIVGTDSHHDGDRYYDLDSVRTQLKQLGLEQEDGTFASTPNMSVPDLSDLSVK